MSKIHEEIGRVAEIMPTETVTTSAGTPYDKRLIVVEVQNGTYIDRLPFNFGGDKCAQLDTIQVGQWVTVSFRLSGWKDRSLFVRPVSVAPLIEQSAGAPEQPKPQTPMDLFSAVTGTAPSSQGVGGDLPF